MSFRESISDEQLNALLDGELDESERYRVLAALSESPELKTRFEDLKKIKSMLRQAYQDVPQPRYPNQLTNRHSNQYKQMVSAAALLLFGVILGWYGSSSFKINEGDNIQAISEFESELEQQKKVASLDEERILLHISSNDEKRVEKVLQVAEDLLRRSDQQHRHLRLEVVANAEGLAILRTNSPYAHKIASLSKTYRNVKFLACGIAKQTAALKEGRPIELLPEADNIPAALEEILKRLKEGWMYVRG